MLAVFGSVTPLGAVTVAVSEIEPVAEALIVPVPGTAVVLPSFTVTFRSACTVILSVSVSLLFAGLGSAIPLGPLTLAVSDTVPVAAALSLPAALYVTELPGGIVTVLLIFPLPLSEKPVAPPVCVAVKVIPVKVVGKVSFTTAPVT